MSTTATDGATRAVLEHGEGRRTSMIRVLQIADTLGEWAGGPTQNAYELHEALNRRNDVVSCLLSVRGDEERPIENPATHWPAPGSQRRRSTVGRVLRLLRAVCSCDVIAIHGYYQWWAPIVSPLGRALGKGVVMIPHGGLTRHQRTQSRSKKRAWEVLAGPVTRAANSAFIVASEIEEVELLDVFPRLTVLVGGIGTPLPAFVIDGRPSAVDDQTGAVRLLSLSRIAPKKRIDLMIDAVADLQRRGVTAHLVVAGTGSPQLEQDLRAQADRLGVAEAIEFVGMLAGEAKEAAYAQAQYFLAPSDDENFGISPAEALARGLPMIASTAVASATGLPDTAGALIPSPTGTTVADAILRLRSEDHAAMRVAARRFAEEHYAWDAVARQWAQLFALVLAVPRSRTTR